MSGRAVRKQPFLAHAAHVQAPTCDLGTFLAALQRAVQAARANAATLPRGASA